MPEYLSPGVYVEEIDAGPKPIEGVSTSTAGAVGVTARGPTRGRQGPYSGKPELVTSFAEFVRKFGGYLAEPPARSPALGDWWKFPLSVKAFFDNGGQRMYVKRAFSSTARRAEATLGTGIISELVQNAAAADTQLRLRHLVGIEAGMNLTLVVNGVRSVAPLTVDSYGGSGTVNLAAAVGQDLVAGRDWVEVVGRTAAPNPPAPAASDARVMVFAKSEGEWGGPPALPNITGTGVSVQIRPMIGGTLRIAPGAAVETTVSADITITAAGQTVVEVGDINGFAAGDIVEINGQQFTVDSASAGAPMTLTLNGNGTDVDVVQNDVVARRGPLNTQTTVTVSNASLAYVGAILEFDDGRNKEEQAVTSINGNELSVGGNLSGSYTAEHRIRIIEAEVIVRYRNRYVTEQEEIFSNLRFVDIGGAPNYFLREVNDRSVLATIWLGPDFVAPTDLTTFPSVPLPAAAPELRWSDLIGGQDGFNDLQPEDFVGEDGGSGNRTGIQALEDIDDVSICLVPNIHSTIVHDALISHCEILKDRFAIVDPPVDEDFDIEDIRTFRETYDTKYAALYYPSLEVRDPSLRRNVLLGPSGHLAGIYARVDVERGVHKAPANEVIRGITKIARDVTKREQDMLNPRNINALRFFPGRGNRVWGARVLTSDSAWKYINVRRLFIYVEESIDEGTQWVVFEPNDEPLWARVRQSITNFLTTVWRTGALEGTKADQAFFVKCDRTTMTQDDIDNGRLICVIGIAPVKPAEFVIFRIQQKTRESQTT